MPLLLPLRPPPPPPPLLSTPPPLLATPPGDRARRSRLDGSRLCSAERALVPSPVLLLAPLPRAAPSRTASPGSCLPPPRLRRAALPPRPLAPAPPRPRPRLAPPRPRPPLATDRCSMPSRAIRRPATPRSFAGAASSARGSAERTTNGAGAWSAANGAEFRSISKIEADSVGGRLSVAPDCCAYPPPAEGWEGTMACAARRRRAPRLAPMPTSSSPRR